MDVVSQGLRTSGFNGVQSIDEHGAEDLDHLPVAARLSFQLAPHTVQGRWQIPVLERRPVAQRAGFAGQDRDVMERVVDRLATTEGAIMAGDNLTILPAFQPVGIGADLDGPPDRTGIDRVAVLVEAHEAGLGHRRRHRVEAIEWADIGDQAWPLGLKYPPDCLVRDVGVLVCFGVGDAPIFEPGIQFCIGFELGPGHEEPLPDHAHLVLDLALLPT
jgi:hypothetical protein